MKNGTISLRHSLLLGSVLAALAGCACLSQGSSGGQNFATPDQAVNALVEADRAHDKQAMLKILGPQSEKLIYSGDPVADRDGQQKFIAAYDAAHGLENESADRRILVVGTEEWPLPIPLVRGEAGWSFDTEAGAQAIIDRRIGRNELNVIETCREYVRAQREYADMHKQSRGYREYAQRITSTPGTHDGLYWPVSSGKMQSPFGPLMADAQAAGYDRISGHRAPYHGYYFRVLKQQGPAAAGGKKDYMVNGHMTSGFALIAYPAVYGDSGIKSFIVNQNGIVYEKDLGLDTEMAAAEVWGFNPDDDWQPVQ